MSRNKTLVSLLTELRAECRKSLNPAHNNQARDTQIHMLQSIQEWLWEDFTWPHLRVERELPLQAGQRYYDMPEDLDIDRLEKLEVRYNGRWIPVEPGISNTDYFQYDSDLDVRATVQCRRWKITEDEQVEIWPIPDEDADADTLEGTLRFTGIRKLRPLVDDADRADLDNRLIVLYAAADILSGLGAKDAGIKLSRANKLYGRLRNGLTPRRIFRMFGQPLPERRVLRGPPPVYYRVVP